MQAIVAVCVVVAALVGIAYWAGFAVCFVKASIEEAKQPGGLSRSAVAIWTFFGTCLVVWLLRMAA